MLSTIHSAAIFGIDAIPVKVETDVRKGMPAVHITGQADKHVKEAIERIHAAIVNSEMDYPQNRVTINMSPAGIPKSGSHFDLAIAMGILASSGQLFTREISRYGFFGELSLSGELMKTDGILPMVMAMRNSGITNVVVPYANGKEAMLVRDVHVYPARNLQEVTEHFNLGKTLEGRCNAPLPQMKQGVHTADFDDVKGQETAKRAVMIAVAGGHGILMMGSPSTGKTMLAERIPTIMPEMTMEETMKTTIIYSISGLLDEHTPWVQQRPFRQPHHKITPTALLGGGVTPRPGEVTLASSGVLFLDEAGEFSRNLIDCLRTPLEEKSVSLMREEDTIPFLQILCLLRQRIRVNAVIMVIQSISAPAATVRLFAIRKNCQGRY